MLIIIVFIAYLVIENEDHLSELPQRKNNKKTTVKLSRTIVFSLF